MPFIFPNACWNIFRTSAAIGLEDTSSEVPPAPEQQDVPPPAGGNLVPEPPTPERRRKQGPGLWPRRPKEVKPQLMIQHHPNSPQVKQRPVMLKKLKAPPFLRIRPLPTS
ncbi:hypothetical protein PVAP13_5NG332924 [Panicum virgatum]|uniref:Uncharacterized protein n=1 Tax=Panicum virgatum TaxID=38727 RepID=A0A8T0RPY6_PANVG|nr:hypothetical protein PVAP13_5NG332924 [Panicum virgatum]